MTEDDYEYEADYWDLAEADDLAAEIRNIELDASFEDGYNHAIDDVKQFLYKHPDITYTELINFLDNLENSQHNEEK